MANDFVTLDVTAGNGDGASSSFVNKLARTVSVIGPFAGLVVIEASPDDTHWLPILTFTGPGLGDILIPFPYMRVNRRGITVVAGIGLPTVTVGTEVVLVGAEILPAPVGLNGAGAGVSIAGMQITGAMYVGPFANPGMAVHLEISPDNTNWAPAIPAATRASFLQTSLCAQYVRQRVVGRTAATPLPIVCVVGPALDVCFHTLTMPVALNGAGVAIDTSECGFDKTVMISSTSGDVAGRIAVQGSNDDGSTWVTAQSWNTPGVKKLGATFQKMRVTTLGFAAIPSGVAVGVAAPELTCDPPSLGAPELKIAGVGGVADQVTALTINTPAGVSAGDLLIAAIALTYAPDLGNSPVAPGAVAVIPAPVGWTVVLPDYPGGVNDLGDLGSGDEQDRIAVFKRIVTATEPANHTFSWASGPGAVSAIGAIAPFFPAIPNFSPTVHVAPAAVTLTTTGGGNPIDVRAQSLTPLEFGEILVTFHVARNGANPAAGGAVFTVPAGMSDFSPAVNARTTAGTTDPLGLAMFVEEALSPLPTGIKTATTTQNNAPPNPFTGMGYDLLIAGCRLPPSPPDPPPPG